MKKLSRLQKPESYELSEQDVKDIKNFDKLLNHLTDVSNSQPLHNIKINDIGVVNQKATLYVESIEKTNQYNPIYCEISTGVDLYENRGIHMSRCIQSIFDLSKKKFKTIDDFTYELAKTVQQKQGSETGFANVSGTYVHRRRTKKTNLDSYDSIELLSKATVSEKKSTLETGVKVHNVTACPCTKTYTKYSIVPELTQLGSNLSHIQKILDLVTTGTHMQLGTTILRVDKENSKVTHKELYSILDNSLHLVYELLKRPDEHDLVMRALKKPQFTEDAAREVAYNAFLNLKNILSPQAKMHVESVVNDSIHIHDVRAVIEKTFGEIKKELDG